MFDVQIVEVTNNDEVREVLSLLRDYFLWLRRRYVLEMPILDAHYDPAEREAELADLRGRYPTILLARVNGVAAGCVMSRDAGRGACEMRRLFVRPAYHGMGIARSMVCRLAKIAVASGHRAIRLETGPRQYEAQALYRSVGFQRISPYHTVSGWFADNAAFFEADAREIACERRVREPKRELELLAA